MITRVSADRIPEGGFFASLSVIGPGHGQGAHRRRYGRKRRMSLAALVRAELADMRGAAVGGLCWCAGDEREGFFG